MRSADVPATINPFPQQHHVPLTVCRASDSGDEKHFGCDSAWRHPSYNKTDLSENDHCELILEPSLGKYTGIFAKTWKRRKMFCVNIKLLA